MLSKMRARAIVSALHERGLLTDYAGDYGEPGYSSNLDEFDGILFANWNSFGWDYRQQAEWRKANPTGMMPDRWPRIVKALEERYELEWSDEWLVIDDKAYRSRHDSYGWQPSFVWWDGDLVSVDELVESGFDDWLDQEIVDQPDRAINVHRDLRPTLREHGWSQVPDTDTWFENGWHPGQDDNPEALMAEWKAQHPHDRVLFYINGVGQFDLRFTMWSKPEEVNDDD